MKKGTHYQFWFGPLNYDVYVVNEVHEHPDGNVELPIKCVVDSCIVVGGISCLFETTVFDTTNPDQMMTVIEWSKNQAGKHKFY
jgi:hypothetical protein